MSNFLKFVHCVHCDNITYNFLENMNLGIFHFKKHDLKFFEITCLTKFANVNKL